MQIPPVFNRPDATFTFMAAGEKWPPIIPAKGWQLPENGHSFEETLTYDGNVGFRAGAGYIGLDLDNPAAFEGLRLPPTTTWSTRPGRFGKLFTGTVPAELMQHYGKPADHSQFKLYKDGKVIGEIKLERCYQVIPNSWKTLDDGQVVLYQMVDSIPPAALDLAILMTDILSLPGISLVQYPKATDRARTSSPTFSHSAVQYPKARPESMPPKAPERTVADDSGRSMSYALSALLTELGEVETAPESTRYDSVYKAGCALGEFIGSGLLPEVPTFNALVEAGCKSGLSTKEAIKSATNGIAKGKRNPRKMPPPTTGDDGDDGDARI